MEEETMLYIPAEENIDNNGYEIRTKALVKVKGEVWKVHKNDPDPFPSSPHAHNYDTGEKLHLGTGDIYKGKSITRKLKEKQLKFLQEQLQRKGIIINFN